MTWAWIGASGTCLWIGHYWPPAYPVAVVCALLALAAHESRPRRRRWSDKGRGGWIHGR